MNTKQHDHHNTKTPSYTYAHLHPHIFPVPSVPFGLAAANAPSSFPCRLQSSTRPEGRGVSGCGYPISNPSILNSDCRRQTNCTFPVPAPSASQLCSVLLSVTGRQIPNNKAAILPAFLPAALRPSLLRLPLHTKCLGITCIFDGLETLQQTLDLSSSKQSTFNISGLRPRPGERSTQTQAPFSSCNTSRRVCSCQEKERG